ncbi:MAG: hypothetical protein HY429_02900 [Candidatus Levybacteria bacterium]|nr:hypothetical protein [Candidatus Levybacteria bacterium]
MNTVLIFTLAAFGLWVLRNTLYWVSLWQRKEYRFDRVKVHLVETGQGKKLLVSLLSVAKWFAIFSYMLVIFRGNFLLPFELFVAGIYWLQAFVVFQEILLGSFARPVLTLKAIFLLSITLGFTAVLAAYPIVELYLWFLIADRLVPLFISFVVFLLSIPTELYYDYSTEKAEKRMREHKNLLVIGVTGSYGKSSTKEYIAQILSKKFTVLKTQGTNNTPIGIANTILYGITKNIEIFVVEMGAYKKGEIAEICNMVLPRIGIITAVNDQHLSLFGSIENTMAAKYELVESLPKEGIAIFNGNNKNAYKLYLRTKKRKVLSMCAGGGNSKKIHAMHTGAKKDLIYAENIVARKSSIQFNTVLKGKTHHMETPLIGTQNVENILPAIYIAESLGMKMKDIRSAVASLTPLPKTMIVKTLPSGVVIVDDTYNANPDAVLAALDYIKIYKKKKIFVFEPMIELGEQSYAQHYRVAKEMANVCDTVFLTNKNFYKQIIAGTNDGQKDCEVKVSRPIEIANYIEKHAKKDDVVAFEGRQSGFALSQLEVS